MSGYGIIRFVIQNHRLHLPCPLSDVMLVNAVFTFSIGLFEYDHVKINDKISFQPLFTFHFIYLYTLTSITNPGVVDALLKIFPLAMFYN